MSKIIAVDFDGCLVENKFPDIGEPIWSTILDLRQEQQHGAKVILWTCRTKEKVEEAVQWCKDNEIHLDAVNENIPEMIEFFGGDTRKIVANEYWDDQAVLKKAIPKELDVYEKKSCFMVNGSQLVACVMYEAIVCKSFPTLPRNAAKIVDRVIDLYKHDFDKITDDFYFKDFLHYDNLVEWLRNNILPIPEIEELNLRQREYDLGYRAADVHGERPDFARDHNQAMTPDEDFIDLDAFIGNLARRLERF